MNEQIRREIAAKVVLKFNGHGGVAKALGYDDRRNVWPWTSGTREFPPAQCVLIEQKSDGEITRQQLRPDDWHLIWPELIGIEGAPGIPEPEQRAA
jgi:DNA-binding transcriptional regulator YdaS (Cro superfamily)